VNPGSCLHHEAEQIMPCVMVDRMPITDISHVCCFLLLPVSSLW
jgi:hypothetical protein